MSIVLRGEQIRAARALLGWSQVELAEKAGVGSMTIKRFEMNGEVRGTVESLVRVQSALQDAGIIFISADSQGSVGVRMKNTIPAPTKKKT